MAFRVALVQRELVIAARHEMIHGANRVDFKLLLRELRGSLVARMRTSRADPTLTTSHQCHLTKACAAL